MNDSKKQEIINQLRDIQLSLFRLSPEIKNMSNKSYTANSLDRVLDMIHIIRIDLEES